VFLSEGGTRAKAGLKGVKGGAKALDYIRGPIGIDSNEHRYAGSFRGLA